MSENHASEVSAPRTLAEKLWDDHVVVKGEDGADAAFHRPAPDP